MSASQYGMNPPHKQPRVLSCVLCQKRKIKCDRTIPCANCIKVCRLFVVQIAQGQGPPSFIDISAHTALFLSSSVRKTDYPSQLKRWTSASPDRLDSFFPAHFSYCSVNANTHILLVSSQGQRHLHSEYSCSAQTAFQAKKRSPGAPLSL